MASNKYEFGELVEQSLDKNTHLLYNKSNVRGVSNNKMLIPTKANMDGVSVKNYLLIKPSYFAYGPVTSRNGDKLSICYNDSDNTYICSGTYMCFHVKRPDLLDSKFLFIYFNRPEFDRYSRFCSWGSARETFDWEDFCHTTIELPPLEIQKKYVAIYNAMTANQKSYEKRLDDLKLACEAYIEELKHNKRPLKGYIEQVTAKNEDLDKNAVGISKEGFIRPKVDVGELKNYTIVSKNNFVYSPPRINIGSIELYKADEKAVCSPIYVVFKTIDENKLNSDYLNIWLHRKEFFRSTDFYSVATVRNNFDYGLMEETQIAIPPIEIQKSIADLYNALYKSRKVNEALKQLISKMCPILIKAAISEANKNNF